LKRPIAENSKAWRALVQKPPRLPPSDAPSYSRKPWASRYRERPIVKSSASSPISSDFPDRQPMKRSSAWKLETSVPNWSGTDP
jgi:hypothetical protein